MAETGAHRLSICACRLEDREAVLERWRQADATQEIVHMTRLQLGDAYTFAWTPTMPAQGHTGVSKRRGGTMQTFDWNELEAESERAGQRWHEFLRVPSLSMGLYRLKTGQADEQRPHTEDEVYVVLSGKAVFRAGGREHTVAPGSILFIERAAEHRFVDITEDLTVLVFFAPPEGSLKDGGAQ